MANPTLFTEYDGDVIFDANLKTYSQLEFRVFVFWDTDVTEFSLNHITLTGTVNTGSITVQKRNIIGSKRLYVIDGAITNLPPSPDADRNGTLTLSISPNAVPEGNPARSLTFNYTYYHRDTTYPYTNARPDAWTEIASNIGRYQSLTYQDGVLYGLSQSSAILHAFNPSNGNRLSSRDIDLPSVMDNGVLLNGAFYGLRAKKLEKYIKSADGEWKTLVNAVQYQEDTADANSDLIIAGRNAFHIASEARTGTPGTPGTPGHSAVNFSWANGVETTFSGGPRTATVTVTSGGVWVSVDSGPGTSLISSQGSQSFSFNSSIRISSANFVNSFGSISIPGTSGTPGTPSSLDYKFVRGQYDFGITHGFQEQNINPKEFFLSDSSYPMDLGEMPIPEYDSGAYDYEDVFVTGYDNEQYYGKIGTYFAAFDEDLRIKEDTIVKSVSKANTEPPAYAMDADYIYRATDNHLYRLAKSALGLPKVPAQIHPIIVSENSTIDLRKYVKNFTRIVFDEGESPPGFLSLSGHTLTIGTPTQDEIGFSLKLRAFNRNGATERDAIQLDIFVVKPASTPTWQDIQRVSMAPNETIDITEWVSDAESVSSVSLPTGASLTGFELTIGTIGGNVTLRATKGAAHSDHTFGVDLTTQGSDIDVEHFRYRVEIAGIDVSSDLVKSALPEISKTLDTIQPFEYKIDTSSFGLQARSGFYDSQTAQNFWSLNNLNEDGFMEEVTVKIVSGVEEYIVLKGRLFDVAADESADTVKITVISDDYNLEKTLTAGHQKYARLTAEQQTHEGIYAPEPSLLPIIIEDVNGYQADGTAIPISKLPNQPENVLADGTSFVDSASLRTQGGELATGAPLISYKMPYLRQTVERWIALISRTVGFFNPKIEVDRSQLPSAISQSYGSLQYNLLKTRITHIVRDWVFDATSNRIYALLSEPSERYEDMLVALDRNTGRFWELKRFDASLTTLKLAYAAGVFYIGVTESFSLDRSTDTLPADTLEVVGKYLPRGSSKILQWTVSSDTLSDFVTKTATYPFLAGTHYHVGFENEVRTFDWEGTVPDSRGALKIHNRELYYRFANDDRFGVAKKALSGGAVSTLLNITRDELFTSLKFDFDISGAGVVFLAYCEQSLTGSSLKISKYENGSESEVLTDTKTFAQLMDTAPEVSNTGGWYAGVHEVHLDGTDLYVCVEIGRTDIYYSSGTLILTRSALKGSGSAIYKVDTAAATPSLTLVEGYDFSQESGRSLVSYENRVFFVEAPSEIYKFPIYNPDFDGRQTEIQQLKSIESTGAVTPRGRIWYDTQPFGGTPTKILNIGDSLIANMQYGNMDGILQANAPASQKNNFQVIEYGRTLRYIIESLPETDILSLYKDIAKKTNTTFFIDANQVKLTSNLQRHANLNGSVSQSAVSFPYRDAVQLPSRGEARIGSEIIAFTGRTATALTGVTRGRYNTEAVSHADGATLLIIDRYVAENEILLLNKTTDKNKIFNRIQEAGGFFLGDALSQGKYQLRPFEINIGLTTHDRAWIQRQIQTLLDEFKTPENVVSFQLKTRWNIQIGDTLAFKDGTEIIVLKALSVNFRRGTTSIIGRTIR